MGEEKNVNQALKLMTELHQSVSNGKNLDKQSISYSLSLLLEGSEERIKELEQTAMQVRLDALDMAFSAGEKGAHLGGGLSCVEILTALYGEVLRYDVKNPHWANRDRFILVGFICGNATSYFWSKAICPPIASKSPSVTETPGLVKRG